MPIHTLLLLLLLAARQLSFRPCTPEVPAICGRSQCRRALGMCSSVDPRSAKYSFSSLAPLFLFNLKLRISPRYSDHLRRFPLRFRYLLRVQS